MTGVQALARLGVTARRADRAAGRDTALFISGYEGSPLRGSDLELQRHADVLAAHDIVFRPAVNEELAATSVQGTQLAPGTGDARVGGVTGFWYGKSPGLDRASDALRHANLMGTDPRGGAVAFVGDDPAAKSSTVPGASEFLLADLGLPVLDVSQALGRLGLDERERHARGLRVFRLGMIHPLVPAEVEDFTRGLDEVIVIEEKRSFVEAALKDILYGVP